MISHQKEGGKLGKEKGPFNINVHCLLMLFIIFPDKRQTRLASLESIMQRLKFP